VLWSLMLLGCFKVVKPADPADTVPDPGAFPHEIFDDVLGTHVTPEGLVDYKTLQGSRAGLDEYVGYLAISSPHRHPDHFPGDQHALAYWINAYNALAITGVIDRPGLKSVIDQKIEYFALTRYLLGKDKVTLYVLENGIVRKEFDDPRIHFALNCQSMGCPRLPDEAFLPATLDAQLDAMTVEFVSHPEKVRVADGEVQVSSIFKWYAEDFEAAGGAVAFINQYRPEPVPTDLPVTYIDYDWALIAQPGRMP